MQRAKIITTIVILVLLAATIHIARLVNIKRQSLLVNNGSVGDAMGNPYAPIHVIEFTDFQCPACRDGALFLKEYMEQRPGKIYLQFKHYPIFNLHSYAKTTSIYAQCASQQGKFWPMHDQLFEGAMSLKHSLSVAGRLNRMAKSIGLDLEKLKMCVADPATEEIILRNKEEGKASGVKATPTYFVNGQMVVGKTALNRELEKYLGEKRP